MGKLSIRVTYSFSTLRTDAFALLLRHDCAYKQAFDLIDSDRPAATRKGLAESAVHALDQIAVRADERQKKRVKPVSTAAQGCSTLFTEGH